MSATKILCIGGANIDWSAQCAADSFPVENIPFKFQKSFGGVVHIIAQNLKDLGFQTGLMSVVGNDQEGNQFLKLLKDSGIENDLVIKMDSHQTASIIFVVGKKGNILLTISRTEIYDVFKGDILLQQKQLMGTHETWILDTDLCEEAIRDIAKNKPNTSQLYAIVACPAKSRRVYSILNSLDGLFLNQEEASQLLQSTVVSDQDAMDAANFFRKQGVKQVFITLGERGVCVVTDTLQEIFPSFKAECRDSKGAGDAFAAGVIAGVLEKHPIELCVNQGLIAASLIIEADGQTYGALSSNNMR